MKNNRLRTIEIGIFTVVSLVFLNSVYHLFTDGRFLSNQTRRPLSAKAKEPKRVDLESAKALTPTQLAGAQMIPYETRCATEGENFETNATKVRINGPFCGATPGRELAGERPESLIQKGSAPIELRIFNRTNNYSATVMSDHQSGSFSTDFIPLEPGLNQVSMEFLYKPKKSYKIELSITRR